VADSPSTVLLVVAALGGEACNALVNGELDAASRVASTSPSTRSSDRLRQDRRAGQGEMRVYDKHSKRFWPARLRHARPDARRDAVAQGCAGTRPSRLGLVVRRQGGITRPEARATCWRSSGLRQGRLRDRHGVYLEVTAPARGGDETELNVFTTARARPPRTPAGRDQHVKGNIGHTKAAAGVAPDQGHTRGAHQIIPPAPATSNRPSAHRRQAGTARADHGRTVADGQPVRAAVSSMGFGGINAHIVVDQADGAPGSH